MSGEDVRIDDRPLNKRVDSGSPVLSIPLAKCVAIRRSVSNGLDKTAGAIIAWY